MPQKERRIPCKPHVPKAAKTTRQTCVIYDDAAAGKVQISEDVIATIAALAATEVEGVAAIGGNITYDKAARAGARAIAKGVKVDIRDNAVTVKVIILVTFGCNIPETTVKVQQRVKSTLETMTGLQVTDVHVSVADVTVVSK